MIAEDIKTTFATSLVSDKIKRNIENIINQNKTRNGNKTRYSIVNKIIAKNFCIPGFFALLYLSNFNLITSLSESNL